MVRKKRAKRASKNVPRAMKSSQPKSKIKLIFNNLLLFIILTIVFLILFNFVTNLILVNLFQVMIISFGFISAGLLIALIVLIIIKSVKEGTRKRITHSRKKRR